MTRNAGNERKRKIYSNMVGVRIRKLRLKHKMTHLQISLALGHVNSRAGIWEWESGLRLPSLMNLISLCRIFDVKLEAIVKIDDFEGAHF